MLCGGNLWKEDSSSNPFLQSHNHVPPCIFSQINRTHNHSSRPLMAEGCRLRCRPVWNRKNSHSGPTSNLIPHASLLLQNLLQNIPGIALVGRSSGRFISQIGATFPAGVSRGKSRRYSDRTQKHIRIIVIQKPSHRSRQNT